MPNFEKPRDRQRLRYNELRRECDALGSALKRMEKELIQLRSVSQRILLIIVDERENGLNEENSDEVNKLLHESFGT